MEELILVGISIDRYVLGKALKDYARAAILQAWPHMADNAEMFDDSFMWSTRGAMIFVHRTNVCLSANIAAVVNASNVLLWDRAYEAGIDWSND
jgi:hypothetical protein